MRFLEGRQAGLLVPLFALRSDDDWGIGEIRHIGRFAAWMGTTGHRLLALLPVTEIPPGERSPYAALTAFAIDPIYASLADVDDFVAAGGVAALDAADQAALAGARSCPVIDYDGVRRLKQRALACAFARFQAGDGARDPSRAAAFARFRSTEAGWLEDYVLFRVLLEEHGWRWWREWEPGIRERDPDALALARTMRADRCLFHAYVQWQLAMQWERARAAAQRAGVRLMGDLPFGVAHNSADVWGQQAEFVDDA
jgi:4-alpha-glucanotransferase